MSIEYSLALLRDHHPDESAEPLRQAMWSAGEFQQLAEQYKHAVDKPGGMYWSGETADAAQEMAASDEKAMYSAGQIVLDKIPEALDKVVQAIEFHSGTVKLIDEATVNGYSVSERLVADWIVQPRSTPAIIAQGKRSAAKFTKIIRASYDKWWAAEVDAAGLIDAMSDELDIFFNPVSGLTASRGYSDGMALVTGKFSDPAVLARVHAASLLDEQDLKNLATGGRITIPSNKMQYLYQFAQAFDGKSPGEIAAIKAALPMEARAGVDAGFLPKGADDTVQADLARAFALVSNKRVKSGVCNLNGPSESAKGSFIPAAGSLSNLPDSVRDSLTRSDRVSVTQGMVSGTPITDMHGVGDLQDVAKIFNGASDYMNGSEAGRSMLDAVGVYADADIDHDRNPTGGALQSDAHGALGGPLADQDTALRNAMAEVYHSAGQDHTAVHHLAHGDPNAAEQFLRGINQESWGDQSGEVSRVLDWTGDHSQMGAEVANAEGHYLADHKAELQNMPGGDEFAKINPELADTIARAEGQYLGQYAHPEPTHAPAVEAFDNADQMRDMLSILDEGRQSATTINEAGREQYEQLLAEAAANHSDIDLNAAGRLSHAMLAGAIDSVGSHPDDEDLEQFKKIAGWVPQIDKILDADELIRQLQQHGTQLPDGFAENLAHFGSLGNIASYQTGIIDALLQAQPGIIKDPTIGQYITNGHFDPLAVHADPSNAETDLSNWFKNTAVKAPYNFDMGHWDDQQQQGSTHPDWANPWHNK